MDQEERALYSTDWDSDTSDRPKNSSQGSETLDKEVFPFKWFVDNLKTTRSVDTHRSPEFSCRVGPLKTLRFQLVLKIRENFYELYMESKTTYDVDVQLAVSIRSNEYRRSKPVSYAKIFFRV